MSQLTTCFVLVTRLLSFFNLLSWSWEKYFMGKCSAEWLHIGIWWREEVTEADEATTVTVLKWNRFAPDQSTALPTWPTGVNLPSLPTPTLTTYPLTSRDQHHPPVSPLVDIREEALLQRAQITETHYLEHRLNFSPQVPSAGGSFLQGSTCTIVRETQPSRCSSVIGLPLPGLC